MKLFSYFDLGLRQHSLVLGKKTRKEEEREDRQGLLLTVLMYVFVWLGVLSQKVMALWQTQQPINLETMGSSYLLVALIIATVIFPAVFPKILQKEPEHAQKNRKSAWLVAKMCLAFQQGFFWQSLLSLITPK